MYTFFCKVEKLHADYEGCDKSKGCFGDKKGCTSSGTCTMMVSYAFDDTTKQIKFTLHLKSVENDQYVAMGLSDDSSMGEELVFFCQTKINSAVGVRWNNGKSPSKDVKIEDIGIIGTETTRQIDGVSTRGKSLFRIVGNVCTQIL